MIAPGRLILIVLTAVAGLLLLRQFLLQRSDGPPIGYGYSPAQITQANKICTGLHGDEKERGKHLTDCNEACALQSTGEAHRQCLARCREESQAFAKCLLQYTTPP
jgi:hypothetical protein